MAFNVTKPVDLVLLFRPWSYYDFTLVNSTSHFIRGSHKTAGKVITHQVVNFRNLKQQSDFQPIPY